MEAKNNNVISPSETMADLPVSGPQEGARGGSGGSPPQAEKVLYFDPQTFDGGKLPEELRELKQFIGWALKSFGHLTNDGSTEIARAKTPLDTRRGPNRMLPGGGTQEKTWSTLDDAIKASKHWSQGVGFAFKKGGDITGIDLDNCVVGWTDEGVPLLSSMAQWFVNTFPTYWEWSPSHRDGRPTGLHGILRGTVLKTVAKDKVVGLEIYSEGRYFTVTGNQFPGSANIIAPLQEKLDEAYERYVTPALAVKKTKPAAASSAAKSKGFQWPDGKIHNTGSAPEGAAEGVHAWLLKYAGYLRYKNVPQDQALQLVAEAITEHFEGPVSENHGEDVVTSVYRSYPAGPAAAFENRDGGLYGSIWNEETEEREDVRIGAPLHGIERARDDQGDGWSLVVQFHDEQMNEKQVVLPSKELHSTGRQTQQRLADAGYHPPLGHCFIENQLLMKYLDSLSGLPLSRRTDRTGWDAEGNTFTLSSGIIGSEEILRFEGSNLFSQAGTYDAWRQGVSEQMRGNSVGIFWMSGVLTSPILRYLQDVSGNPLFNLWGKSSVGKSTCNKAAASVWGDPKINGGKQSYLQTCKSTENAFESLAQQVNDTGLILDDAKQLDADSMEQLIFMLETGKGKVRMTKEIRTREAKRWRGVTLLTSEKTTGVKAGEGSKSKETFNAGSEVRMPNIPAIDMAPGQ
jgi:hypothetical protein